MPPSAAAYPGTVLLRYSLLRLTVLAAVGLGAWAAGLRDVWWLLATAVGSLLVSLVVLRGPRDQVVRHLEERRERRAADLPRPPRRRGLDDTEAEDAADDAARGRDA